MPIGPITPGSYVNVTPDGSLTRYSNIQAPTATMPEIASDIQALTLVVANVSRSSVNEVDGGTIAGDVIFNGAVNFGGTSIVQHDSGAQEEFDNTPDFAAGANFLIGGSLSVARPATFSYTGGTALSCTGIMSISGANGSFYSGGTNGSEFATDVLVDAKLIFNGSGHEVKRVIYPSGTTDHTYTIADGDRFVFRGLTASRNVTFQNTGAQNGIQVEILVPDVTGFTLSVKRHDGTTINQLVGDGVSGSKFATTLWHDGTDWFVAGQDKN